MLSNQVEVILKKHLLYREIDALLLNFSNIYASHKRILQIPDLCTAFERDKAVSSLRFLCMFYDLPHEVFFLSTTLFDSLLENNQISSAMFDILHVSCFYVSAISYGHLIQFEDVIKFASCKNVDLLYSTTNFILTKLQASLEAFPTVLALLKLFLGVLLPRSDDFFNIVPHATMKLELLILCHKFILYRVDELILALCHYILKQFHDDDVTIEEGVMEMIKQYQIDEREYYSCLREIQSHMEAYESQQSVNPRLKLSWTVSKKLLMKMKPSTKFASKLEPLLECSHFSSCYSVDAETLTNGDMTKSTPGGNDIEEISTKESGVTTFQSKISTVSQKHPTVFHKLLFDGKVFTICMNDFFPFGGNKTLTDGKFQPALLFLPVSNLSTNQFVDLRSYKISKKRRKNLLNVDLLYLLSTSDNQSKYFVIPVRSLGQLLKLMKS